MRAVAAGVRLVGRRHATALADARLCVRALGVRGVVAGAGRRAAGANTITAGTRALAWFAVHADVHELCRQRRGQSAHSARVDTIDPTMTCLHVRRLWSRAVGLLQARRPASTRRKAERKASCVWRAGCGDAKKRV